MCAAPRCNRNPASKSPLLADAKLNVKMEVWIGAAMRPFRETFQADRNIRFGCEKFLFRFSENMLISPHPAPSGGALRPIVTNVGGGMRWT
jgi:hypothetical protein